MSRLIRQAAVVAALLLPLAGGAQPKAGGPQVNANSTQLNLMVAVDPSDPNAGFVSTEEISAGLSRASGKSVHAVKTENLGDAMRSTRTGEYDIYIAPAHVAASALGHGYDLIGSTQPMQPYVFVTNSRIARIAELKDKRLYLSQQDSMAAYIAKGMLNEAGQSLKTFKEVMYKKTTGAGLFAVGADMVDATVAPEGEAEQWLKANPGKGVALIKSHPVPLGMTALVKTSLPDQTKSRVAAWFTGAEGILPGIGRITNHHEAAPYKYVASLGYFTPAQLPGVTRVTAAEVRGLIEQKVAMVDVRTEREYNEGHIPGAILFPYHEKSLKDTAFDAAADSFPGLEGFDKTKPVIFACNGAECWKSYKAAKSASAHGFKTVYWFRGGLPEWKDAGLAVATRAGPGA